MNPRDAIEKQAADTCCSSGGCCGVPRREFVKTLALGAAAALTAGVPVMAGPFKPPTSKNSSPPTRSSTRRGSKSLFARGQRDRLSRRGTGKDRHAGRRHLRGPALPGRRRQTLALGHLQSGTSAPAAATTPSRLKPASPLEQGFALRVTSAAGKTQVRPLDQPRLRRHQLLRRVSDRAGRIPRSRVAGGRVAGGLFALHPAEYRRFQPAGHGAAVHGEEHRGAKRRSASWPAGWKTRSACTPPGDAGHAARTASSARTALLLDRAGMPLPRRAKAAARPTSCSTISRRRPTRAGRSKGTAFGTGPVLRAKIPHTRATSGGPGQRVVNSHASAPGKTSPRRTPDRQAHQPAVHHRAELHQLLDRRRQSSRPRRASICWSTARSSARPPATTTTACGRTSFDVRDWQGKTARLEIVDQRDAGRWGNIGIGQIVFSDRPRAGQLDRSSPTSARWPWRCSSRRPDDRAMAAVPDGRAAGDAFAAATDVEQAVAARSRRREARRRRWPQADAGAGPGGHGHLRHRLALSNLKRLKDGGRYYAKRFASARAVAEYVAENFDRLADQTRLWHDTWYDSTLALLVPRPHVAQHVDPGHLDLPLVRNGRFYGWEGVGCCEGTCTHVWHYAHAVARLFPQLERDLRRRTDFGLAQNPDTGVIDHRGEGAGLAVDGQAGCILRAYREHQMSADDDFLKRIVAEDQAGHGVPDAAWTTATACSKAPQHNTLDQPWFGTVAWLSSLYLAAARACEEMAREVGDDAFARQAAAIFERGSQNIDRELFNGEYYMPRSRQGPSPAASARTTAARSTRCSARAGPFRSAWAASCPRAHVRQALAVAVEVQLHARRRPVPRSQQAGPLVRHGRAKAGC